jgi:FKBP-type peptidyl-prolyl cis-trans isomerase
MFNKREIISAGIAVACVVLALYLIQNDTLLSLSTEPASQMANVTSGVVVVGESADENLDRVEALKEAVNSSGELERMVIDDVKIGVGREVQAGDTVTVHYIGTLQNGQEFDNSHKRGEGFSFTVGNGEVIAGWDQGLLGMKVDGERMLIIPPNLAYGERGIGPIPGDATLVFAIELLSIE